MTAMSSESFGIPRHPLDVRPIGNVYTATKVSCTGRFSRLPEEVFVQILEHLEPTSLLRLGATNRSLYAFSRLDELWKNFFIT